MGTYSITIYCGYSLDFIIGYFKAFSNAIFNFDSYGISIGFGDDNFKTLMMVLRLLTIILRLLMMILIALKMVLMAFDNGINGFW